jgi:thermitase
MTGIRTGRATGKAALRLALTVVLALTLGPIFSTTNIQGATPAIRVAILDTGIDAAHPALAGRVVASVNFTGSGTETDVIGHGTHVAGIIASNAGNVEILNVKVADDSGVTDHETLTKGIVWAVENGAKIINISLTVREPGSDLERAVAEALATGIIVVAAAGNQGADAPSYPAAYPGVISAGATDSQGKIAVWSNGGTAVSTTAPGVSILSAIPGGGWGVKSGTSQAAARVTASIAARL